MLARSNRLKGSRHFSLIYRRGRRTAAVQLVVYALGNNTGQPRLGTVISTKVLKRATARNRQRRRLQAIFRDLQSRLDSYDLIVVVKSDPSDIATTALRQQLDGCLKELGVLH